jgi:murein tripeptide amidase MpaA
MPYLSVIEVESALAAATSAPYTPFTQLITLPNLTWEGRQCHAIKIANGGGNRPGVYFLGGIHSREWGSSDILINFVEQLEQAYRNGTSLTFGSRTFSTDAIQTIVNTLDIIVFPQANPDGRNYSMTSTDPMWRKNRRTAAPNSASCPGVDVNRNYDFLWNFPKYFDPSSGISDSTDPCDAGDPDNGTYHGPNAFSEPESQNAKWILDNFPNVAFFVDLHSYGEDLLYSWGDDEDQTSDQNMNFLNPAFDGKRGVQGDAYKEYIPSNDFSTALNLANAFHDGILAVRGRDYTVKPSFKLYPTAGTSDDYAYSRHFVDSSKGHVISYTLEWGSPSNPTPFHPPYSEMQNIIQEITCGLLAFCLWVRDTLKASAFILNRNPLGQDEIDARRKTGGLPIQDAFRVVVDGFTATELGLTGPGSTLDVPSPLPPGVMPITCTGNTADNGDYGTEIQRFTFFYNIDFDATDTAFHFTTDTKTLTLNATPGGVAVSAEIVLIKQPDPFMLHGDPAWLSVDLRVFVVRANETKFPGVTMGPDASAAPGFIQQLIATITPAQFDTLSPDENASKLYLFPTDGPFGTGDKVFNFAVAKVHYIGLIGAKSVRVFFRMFKAQSTTGTFDFPPGAQYRRATSNPEGQPISLAGIVGGEYVTIPCFAAPRIDTTALAMDQQTDHFNVQDFTAHPDGSEVDQFFGCWLDINQPFKVDGTPNNVLPIKVPATNVDGPFDDPSNSPVPIQQAVVRSEHQCLIAEIAFDLSPIPVGQDPSNWDKLAQRNLAWSDVGSASALTAFEVRPTPAELPPGQRPDELMIDWGNTPRDSSAHIYLPAVSISEVLALAAKMYTSHRLQRIDDHTLQCATNGVTYVPVPPGTGTNFAGLLSIHFDSSLEFGQVFNIVVRQVTNAFAPPPPARTAEEALSPGAVVNPEWRRVIGAFQLNVPVGRKELLLAPEQKTLSVMRYIAQAIPQDDRWAPVAQRYVETLASRVKVFGGDPNLVTPSPTGDWYHSADGLGGLLVTFADSSGNPVSDVADVFLQHQVLSDHREIRRWPTDAPLFVPDLISTQTGIYELQVLPDHHEAVGRFVTINDGELTQVQIELEPTDDD